MKIIHRKNILSLLCWVETALPLKDLGQQTHNCSSYSRGVTLWISTMHLFKIPSQIEHFVNVVFGKNSFTCQRSWSTDIKLVRKYSKEVKKNFDQVSFENSFTNTNLFTTSESPNILILKSLFLFIEGGQKKHFHWSKKYFRPIKNVFLPSSNR